MVSVYGAMIHERKARIWQLWRQGRPMIEIARDIVKPPATVYSYLLYHGRMEPRERIRRADCLSFEATDIALAWQKKPSSNAANGPNRFCWLTTQH